MKTQVLTVWDSAAKMYLEPFFAPSLEHGLRSFREAANAEGHQFNKYPEDYALFHIGEFNPETGRVDTFEELRSLGLAIYLVERKELEVVKNA